MTTWVHLVLRKRAMSVCWTVRVDPCTIPYPPLCRHHHSLGYVVIIPLFFSKFDFTFVSLNTIWQVFGLYINLILLKFPFFS